MKALSVGAEHVSVSIEDQLSRVTINDESWVKSFCLEFIPLHLPHVVNVSLSSALALRVLFGRFLFNDLL